MPSSANGRGRRRGDPAPAAGSSRRDLLATSGPRRRRDVVKALGPGVVAGASDTDPTTVAAVAVIGAATVFRLAWLALLVAPALIVVQIIATRLAVLGHVDLVSAVRRRYGREVRWLLALSILVVTVLTLAADLEAGAAAIDLLAGVPAAWLVAPLAALVVISLLVGAGGRIVTVLKYVALALFAYAGAALLAHADWGAVLFHSAVPELRLDHQDIAGALALLGTTLTAYVYVWQTVEVAAEQPGRAWLRAKETDAVVGIVFAVVVIWFILIATGATLGVHHHAVNTTGDAARALRPLAGSTASVVFGIGLLASAAVALPVLLGTAGATVGAELGWDERARSRGAGRWVLVGTAVAAVLVTLAPISTVQLLFDASIVGGIGAPVVLVCLLLVAADRDAMRGEPVTGGLLRAGWVVTSALTALGVLYVVEQLHPL